MAARELMPYDGLKEFTWSLDENQSELDTANEVRGQVIEWGRATWTCRAVFGSMNASVYRKLDSFIKRRKKSLITFTAFRPLFRAPLLNPAQTNTGLGIGTVDIENSTVGFTGLSANVSEGDMFSYRTANNGYYVGQAVEAVSISGGAATVKLEPAPMPKHATTPQVRAFEALGEFRLVAAPQNTEQHLRRGTYSFTCKQYVE